MTRTVDAATGRPPRATRRRRAGGVPAVLAVLLACAGLVVGGALVAVPAATAGAADAAPIEDFHDYVPQSTCSPRAKPGTVRLAAWLQETYPGSGSSGISRPCSSGGTSEHKEGRAFDWRLSVGRARDRRYAARFIAEVQRTDAEGNVGALGRRMGIMYLIWDDRIYSAWDEYEPSPYRHSACEGRRLRRCSATLRHRDHLHVSLSRRGGRGRTSWYAAATAG